MKKGYTWIFGVLLLAILAYTGWYSFEKSTLLMGETKSVYGKVIDVFPSEDVKSYSRRVKYVYSSGNKSYVDFKKLGTEDKKQAIGNRVKITYSLKNPKNNKVNKLYNDHRSSKGAKYYSSKEKGFIEIHFINGIFKYTNFADKGKVIHDFVGEYTLANDSILFNHFNFKTDPKAIVKPELFIVNSGKNHQFTEAQTNRIFKRIISK